MASFFQENRSPSPSTPFLLLLPSATATASHPSTHSAEKSQQLEDEDQGNARKGISVKVASHPHRFIPFSVSHCCQRRRKESVRFAFMLCTCKICILWRSTVHNSSMFHFQALFTELEIGLTLLLLLLSDLLAALQGLWDVFRKPNRGHKHEMESITEKHREKHTVI